MPARTVMDAATITLSWFNDELFVVTLEFSSSPGTMFKTAPPTIRLRMGNGPV